MIVANRPTLSGIHSLSFPCKARFSGGIHNNIRLRLSPTPLVFGRMQYRTAHTRFVQDKMTASGHWRPGRTSGKSGHVRYAADADWIRELARQQGAWANIPLKRNRKDPILSVCGMRPRPATLMIHCGWRTGDKRGRSGSGGKTGAIPDANL